MTQNGALFVETDPRILLERLADYVRPYPAKNLARWFGCAEKTADSFRRGESWPNARHWKLIVQHFGRDVLAAVFEPEIDEPLARLRREEAELRGKLHEIEARRIQMSGGLVGAEERSFAPSDRHPLERDLPFEEGV